MAKWTDTGHGMRRRMGAPMSSLEAAGPANDRQHMTSEEHYDRAKQQDSPRISMGEDQVKDANDVMSGGQDADDYMAKAASPAKGMLRPKGNVQAQDPTGYGGVGHRNNVMYNERLGASYRVSVPYTPTVDPTAGPTMANARTIPSVLGRQNPNFMGAVTDQY